MKGTSKNTRQLKALIDDMSKTVETYANNRHLKDAVNAVFGKNNISRTIQGLKAWNKETFPIQLGEKRPQTDLGDQFIF